jgi:hypothetical protein
MELGDPVGIDRGTPPWQLPRSLTSPPTRSPGERGAAAVWATRWSRHSPSDGDMPLTVVDFGSKGAVMGFSRLRVPLRWRRRLAALFGPPGSADKPIALEHGGRVEFNGVHREMITLS